MSDNPLISRLAVNPGSSITVPLFFFTVPLYNRGTEFSLENSNGSGASRYLYVDDLLHHFSGIEEALVIILTLIISFKFHYIYNLIEFRTNWKSFSTHTGNIPPKIWKTLSQTFSLLSFRIILQSSSWRNNWTKNFSYSFAKWKSFLQIFLLSKVWVHYSWTRRWLADNEVGFSCTAMKMVSLNRPYFLQNYFFIS